MAGGRYQKVDLGTLTWPVTIQPDSTSLSTAQSIGVSNVRGLTVAALGPDGEQLMAGGFEAYALVPTNVLVNNAPEAATMRWCRAPDFDFTPGPGARDNIKAFDVTGKGLVAFRLAFLPAGVQYSGAATGNLTLLYSVRLWGI